MVGKSWSEKSLSWMVTTLPFNATKIHVNFLSTSKLLKKLAGLTVGDPVLRTKEPLSVELGPG